MELYKKIKDIHSSDAYGILVETGGGMPVSNALLEVEGASKTVYVAECPYSKPYQDKKYFNAAKNVIPASDLSEEDNKIVSEYWHEFKKKHPAVWEKLSIEESIRSVSIEAVKSIINHHLESNLSKIDQSPQLAVNFIYASSFQIGDHNDKSTHGWIGIWERYLGTRYFHVSIHDPLSRKEYIQKISQIGIDLLYQAMVVGDHKIPSNCCIDNVISNSEDSINHLYKIMLTESLKGEDDDNFLCIRNGRFVRMEDFFRDKKEILIYKGSFNPIHNGHINNIELTKVKFGSNPVITFSLEVYQKGWIDTQDLLKRIKMVSMLGYDVMITKKGLFNENTKYIRKKFKTPIVYVVGTDVMHKLLTSSYNIINVEESKEYKQSLINWRKYDVKHERYAYEDAQSFYLNSFKEDFSDVRFFCISRKGFNDLQITHELDDYMIYTDEHVTEYYYISSTKIRELKSNGYLEEIKKLIPEKIFQNYMES